MLFSSKKDYIKCKPNLPGYLHVLSCFYLKKIIISFMLSKDYQKVEIVVVDGYLKL